MRELECAWESAYRRPKPKTNRDYIREALTADRCRVAAELPAKTRHTRLTVYDALVTLAVVHGRYTISASKRQLEEAAVRSGQLVLSALADLETVGALRRAPGDGRRLSEAASYTLTPVSRLDHSTPLTTGERFKEWSNPDSHPAGSADLATP